MDLTIFLDLITTVGFPIAAVIVLCWFIWRIYKRSEEREVELREEIKENQAINSQAMTVLAQYAERLEVIQTDVGAIKQKITILTAKQEQ